MEHLLTALPSKIVVAGICATLFWFGGYAWHNARRFIMPALLAISLFYISHTPFAFGSLLAIASLCLGYGDKSPLRHIFGNGWGRGVWGLLSAIGFSLSLFVTGHIFLLFFLSYLILNFTLENALKNIPQWLGDPIIGLGFSCIVFLVH